MIIEDIVEELMQEQGLTLEGMLILMEEKLQLNQSHCK